MELQKDRAGWQRVLIVSCVLELFLGHWGATEDSRQGKGSDCRPGERKPAGGASCEAAGTCKAEEEARVRGGFWKGSSTGCPVSFHARWEMAPLGAAALASEGKAEVEDGRATHQPLSSGDNCQFFQDN